MFSFYIHLDIHTPPPNQRASNDSLPPPEDGETTVPIHVHQNDAYIISNKRISQDNTVYEYIDNHDTGIVAELTSFKRYVSHGTISVKLYHTVHTLLLGSLPLLSLW